MTSPCLAHPGTRCASCPDCETIVAKAERSFTPTRKRPGDLVQVGSGVCARFEAHPHA